MSYSIWNKDYKAKYPAINQNEMFDVLIVGGGITGASVAFSLRSSGLRIGLVEANVLGGGVTANSTAKLTLLQEKIPLYIRNSVSTKALKLYLKAQKEGLNNILRLINTYEIDCNLVKNKGFIYCKEAKSKQKVEELEEIFLEQGFEIKHDDIPEYLDSYYSFNVSESFVFDPVKYLRRLIEIAYSSGVIIFENSRLYDFKYNGDFYICRVNNYQVKTKYLVLCIHYPYFFLPYLIPFRVRQEKSLMNIYKEKVDLEVNAINIDKPVHSIRFFREEQQTYRLVLSASKDNALFSNEESASVFSNRDIITQDHLPLIGFIKKNMFIATGYNTWGMESSNIAGQMISDLIKGESNEYSTLFNPRRFFKKSTLLNFPLCVYVTSYAFLKTYLFKDKAYFSKGVGIYIDNAGNRHKVRAICPHAKCHLVFNETEKTWDCPCHGSRFSLDGDVILGPSNYSIRCD